MTYVFSVLIIVRRSHKAVNKYSKNEKKSVGQQKTCYMIVSLMVTFVVCYAPFDFFHLLRANDVFLERITCTTFRIVSERFI